MNKKTVALKYYKIINAIPFLNKKKGKVEIINNGSILRNCSIISKGINNKLIISRGGYYTNCKFLMYGNNNTISLGNNGLGNGAEFYIEDDNGCITVGNETSFCGNIHLAVIEGTTIKIGNRCLLSSDVVFRTGDSHSILNLEGKRINPSKNIVILDHVWIGHRVFINKGVVIQKNSIVGDGAIVTKECNTENVVIGGIPAKIIKEDINWESARISI